ncbi:hypothetical protein Tco_0461820 [Tanacetum coccineum]
MDIGGSPRRQETMGGALAQTRSERVLEKPNEPPLPEGHISGSGEGSMEYTFELMGIVPPTPHDHLSQECFSHLRMKVAKLKELIAMCIKLSKQVLDLEKEKDAQAVKILKLKQRVKKLERNRKSSISHPRRRIYRQVDTVGIGVSTAAPRTPTTITVFDDEDVTMAMAQTLIKMKEEKAKAKGVVIKDVEDSSKPIRSITTLQPLPTIDPKDKGKGVLVKEEPEKPEKVKRRDQGLAQIESDAELAQRLHEEELAELDRAQKEKKNKKRLLMLLWLKKRATLLAEYFERRKKQLAAERAEAIRNKPPTRAQVRNGMIAYLKHMGKYTHQQLKHKTLEELRSYTKRSRSGLMIFRLWILKKMVAIQRKLAKG